MSDQLQEKQGRKMNSTQRKNMKEHTQPGNEFNGKWKIIEMEAWDQKYVDLVEPGHIIFGDKQSGSLHFGCIYADINYSVNSDNKAVFSFQGDDEGRVISGRGWAKIKNNELRGHIFIHNGDSSEFRAKLISEPVSYQGA